MPRPYFVLDVFTDKPLSGNPLAVVTEASGLSAGRMQAIAREFNLSETVFVLPAENPVHSASVRIFTPARELPFAGHPTVGTAVLLASLRGGEGDAMIVLEETVGAIRCGVITRADGSGRAVFDVPKLPQEVDAPQPDAVAAALGLSRAEIGFENHQLSTFAAGSHPFAFVPVRNLAAIAQAKPQSSLWDQAFPDETGCYVYTRESIGLGRRFHARCFVPSLGFAEDPATGAAAAAFAGAVHKFDATPSGQHEIIIEQGFEMGRPSLISLEMEVEAGGLKQARIGGDAVIVARGELAI